MKIKYKTKDRVLSKDKSITILEKPELWHSGRNSNWFMPLNLEYPFTGKIMDVIPLEKDTVGVGALNVSGYGFCIAQLKYVINED